jgi:hypothetical protein
MAAAIAEYELEALPELEYEDEFEVDPESEEFFNWLRRQRAALARPAPGAPVPWQRRAALAAGRSALTAGAGLLGATLGGPAGAAVAAPVGAGLAALLPERLYEGELELELESELNPIRRAYPDALMEHLGHAAKDAQSEAEAEAFLGALIPLASQLLPRAAPALTRAAPHLIAGLSRAGRALRRQPATRPMVRLLPAVARQTAASLAQQTARTGQPVQPRAAVQTLARQTARVLGSPQLGAQAWQRSRALDQRYHRLAAGMGQRAAEL